MKSKGVVGAGPLLNDAASVGSDVNPMEGVDYVPRGTVEQRERKV